MNAPRSHRSELPSTTPEGRRPDESMTLLTSMMERPLDPGYAAAAERREQEGLPPATSLRSVTVVIAALVVGFLLTVGAVTLRTPETTASRAKEALVQQIEQRREAADDRAEQARTLQEDVADLQSQALARAGQDLPGRLQRLEQATGAAPVSGPGLTVTVDDAETAQGDSADSDPRTEAEANDGKVIARDLQLITNGLWEAGAEAIAINGQRLTSRSAIRFAGEAILVNYRPLTRPYRIEAIGPPSLEVDFADTSGGSYLRSLQDNFDIRVTIDEDDSLTLPSATSLTIRSATVPGSDRDQTSPTTTTESTP